MSMSTYVYGIRPPDEKWNKMLEVYEKCEKLGINSPAEVEDFFDCLGCWPPTEQHIGPEIDLTGKEYSEPYRDDCSEGFVVKLENLPKEITHIKFCNSW